MAHRDMPSRRSLVAAPLLLIASRRAGAAAPFDAFLAAVRADAIGSGVSAATVDAAFAGLQPNAKVLELDSHQPETTQTWEHYRATRLVEQRITAGRRAFQKSAATLQAITQRYGVDPGVIVGIWGQETNYGGFTGGFRVIEALATLAWDGRHDGFFRTELLSALRILDHGDIALARMTGSYAGAMGQPQFMPSSYLTYAVDFDGKGRRDIWDNRNDVLASIANYLARSGWQAGEPWGCLVHAPAGLDTGRNGRDDRRPVAEWQRIGVTRADGRPFARGDAIGAVVMPDGPGGEAYMAFANFGVIRRYNPSDYYALSVGLLGDRVAA